VALDHSCQVQRAPLSERGFDLYGTPAVAVRALLRVEPIPLTIWEPAAGRGNIARVLREHGRAVICSDITTYDFPLQFEADFLAQTAMPAGAEAIITNPPFNLCARKAPFVAHALDLAPKVFLLLRLAFYESESRCSILEQRGLYAIHVFRLRLPMMHRDQWAGKKANSGMSFAWFCWGRDKGARTIINRISWER
jgi:hypothetical protein